MDILFWPIQPFVWNPGLIALVAGLLLTAFLVILITGKEKRRNPWPLLLPTVLWALWIPWEAQCKAEGANIRVDLLLLYPLIFGTTIYGVIRVFKRKNTQQSPAGDVLKAAPEE